MFMLTKFGTTILWLSLYFHVHTKIYTGIPWDMYVSCEVCGIAVFGNH